MGYDFNPDMGATSVVGSRIAAKLIDEILVGIVALFLSVVAGLDALLLVFVGILFPYHIVLEGLYGRTVGKQAMGIVVVNRHGQVPGLIGALGRNLLRIIDGLFYHIVGLVVMAVTERRQRIGDIVGGTLVVRNQPSP